MEGCNLCLMNPEDFESFCALESLKGITVLEIHFISEDRGRALEKRFSEWAARLKPHDLDLQKVFLVNSSAIDGKLIESIGRLRCRLNLYLDAKISFNPFKINWGHIAGLYTNNSYAYEEVYDNCCNTQLVRGGYYHHMTGCVDDFKDEFAWALEILSGKPQLCTAYDHFATALRWNGYRIRMYDQARILVALFCKQTGFPRDVMRIIVSNLCGDDWGEVNFMPLDPKWVAQILEIESKMSEKRRKIQEGNRSLQIHIQKNTGAHFLSFWEYQLAKYENDLKEHELALSEIRERMTTNKFGLPCLGPKKRRKIAI